MLRKNIRLILVLIAFVFGVNVLGKDILNMDSPAPIQTCDKFNKVLMPLPIDMEYEAKNTALLIGVNQIKYDFSLDLFHENELGSDVAFFKQFIDDFSTDEYKKIYSILDNKKNITQQYVKHRIAFLNRVLTGSNGLKLLSQVCQGDHRVFFASINSNGKKKIMSFRFVLRGDDFRYLIDQHFYLDTLLKKVYKFSDNNGQLPIPVEKKHIGDPYHVFDGKYSYQIIANGKRYNSVKINKKPPNQAEDLLDKAVAAYSNIYLLLAKNQKNSFYTNLSDGSAKKAKKWLETLPSNENYRFINSILSREIIHAIDAYPFVIIFYRDIQHGGIIRHEYMIKSHSSKFGFLLTNFYYEDTLDDIFKSQSMFHHNFSVQY